MSSLLKITRITKYITFAVFFSLALSGCSILPQKKTAVDPNANKVIVWSFENSDVWQPIKRDFESQNKGMTLVYQQQALDSNYETRVLNSILSTQKPDIWAMPNDWVYRHKDKLLPMPDTLAQSINMDNDFVPAIKQSVMFDNKIYALSPSAEPLMVYYRDDIFQNTLQDKQNQIDSTDRAARDRLDALLNEPPKIWSDFSETVKLLTVKNGAGISQSGLAFGTPGIPNADEILYLLMLQNETDIVSDNLLLTTFNLPKTTSVGANDIPGQRALEFYTSFADPKSANYSWNDTLGNAVDAFGTGKTAMIFGYSSLQNVLLQKYPDLRYRKAFVPQVSNDTEKITDFARFTAYGVSSLTKMPQMSWGIINILVNDESDSFNSAERLFTAKKSISEDISITNRLSGNPEKLSLLTAKTLVKGRYPADFDAQIQNAIDNVNKGTMDSKTALDLAANNITNLLRKSDW